jgi:hypothetical protein
MAVAGVSVVSGAGVGRRWRPAEVAKGVEAGQAAGDQRAGVVKQRANAAEVVEGDVAYAVVQVLSSNVSKRLTIKDVRKEG